MDEGISSFLSNHPELQYRDERGGIVKCSLSGHEMPCHLEVLQSYVTGKKFAKLRAEVDYKSLEPFIIPSVCRKHQLFCTLTNRHMNKKPAEVKGHIAGRRYTQALERYNAGELTLFKERKRKKSPTSTLDCARETSPVRMADDVTSDLQSPDHEIEEGSSEEEKMEDGGTGDTSGDDKRVSGGDEQDKVTSHKRKREEAVVPGKKKLKVSRRAVLLKVHKRRKQKKHTVV